MGPFDHAQTREISDVNVVPLADVSLVLLIILLVLSPMMRQNMLHVRAAARSEEPPVPQELLEPPPPPEMVLVVGLNPDGFVVGSRRFAGRRELAAYLKDELALRADKKVFLSPHADAAVGLVVAALEAIKGSGAESVALVQTEQESIHGQTSSGATAP